MATKVSLEESNNLRLSLGLKPIVDDAGANNGSDRLAEDNYANKRLEKAKLREAKKISDQIAKVRNRQALNSKLKGSTLGDCDEPEDTLQWVKKSRRRTQDLVKGRQEGDDYSIQDEYSERDLVNLKVSHDFEDMHASMDAGNVRILTLKDSRILNDEEDELENIEMTEIEQSKKRSDLKAKTVLAKYDEDINGVQGTGFRLGGGPLGKPARRIPESGVTNKSLVSMDYARNITLDDYIQGDIEIKKITGSKRRPSRRIRVDSGPKGNTCPMEIDDPPITPLSRRYIPDYNFRDSDEAALIQPRSGKISKTKKLSPEQIAEKVAAERLLDEAKLTTENEGEETSDALMFDDTSEFIRLIQYNPTAERNARPASSAVEQQPHNVALIPVGEAGAGMDEDQDRIKAGEESEFHGENDHGNRAFFQQLQHGSSVASTLSMLHQHGLLSTPTADQVEAERTQLQHDLWLAEQRVNLAQREVRKRDGNGQNMDQATREYENRVREQQEARDRWDAFKDYKPLLNLTEYDEFGRPMTRKEAWKAFSHKFHGKRSGKGKVEKKLKKVANERKRVAMATGDMGINSSFQRMQEKTGQAHFVLSTGNAR
ncbi:hypothetical protein M413DRAFT_24737 [Hebeloma cylindrosporum]|uniref:SART-1 protein n=1 Tax=Hebeloma cylindrosporum TaxID=76867 RepID=A0A0C3C9P6_HEBCY|nr:hypothetical protein M413DRAFT_24737 [Hebeloma cylindrosporum h7]